VPGIWIFGEFSANSAIINDGEEVD
jgi:hypothetical protein